MLVEGNGRCLVAKIRTALYRCPLVFLRHASRVAKKPTGIGTGRSGVFLQNEETSCLSPFNVIYLFEQLQKCRFRVTQLCLIGLNLVDLAADLSGTTYRQSWPLCHCRFHSSLPCRSVHGGGDEAVFCVETTKWTDKRAKLLQDIEI